MSSGRIDPSDPLNARPMGVRTASTITASGIDSSLPAACGKGCGAQECMRSRTVFDSRVNDYVRSRTRAAACAVCHPTGPWPGVRCSLGRIKQLEERPTMRDGSFTFLAFLVIGFFAIVWGYFTVTGSGISPRPYGKVYS